MGPFRGDRIGVVQVHYADELLAKRRISDCVLEANAPGRARLRARHAAPSRPSR